MKSRIILVRHGRTEWNREERFRGRADIGLDSVGMKQAEATAGRLANEGIAGIYSSPLKRALSTAEPLARRTGVPVSTVADLVDVDYGFWQGLTIPEAAQRDPETFEVWCHRIQEVRFPGGESLEEVRRRAAAAVDGLTNSGGDRTIAVVSHVVICRLLTLHLLSIETSRFWRVAIDNCGISIFEKRQGVFVAMSLNDTCHLERPETGDRRP